MKIQSTINQIFVIRCPVSIQKTSPSVYAVYDYEYCAYNEQPLSLTAFCGSCANKNNANLFWGINSPFSYKYVYEIK